LLRVLNELRKKNNWSLQETADLLGIAKSTYAGYESGYREPSLHALIQIADLFNVSIDFILNHKILDVELTSIQKFDQIMLTVDNKQLTKEELNHLIAFIRLKRQLE
jgi:transcriptional regulator with XRE-family HTH domain